MGKTANTQRNTAEKSVNGKRRVPCRTCGKIFNRRYYNQKDCPGCKGPAARMQAYAKAHAQADLFIDSTPTTEADQIGRAVRDSTVVSYAKAVGDLVPLAQELAARAGQHGVTVSDLRKEAEARCIPLPANLSSLGGVMKRARLKNTGRLRKSRIKSRHGNPNWVWVNG